MDYKKLLIKTLAIGLLTVTTATTAQAGEVSMGKMKLTAYCACRKCCGKWANGKTASGTTPEEGRTIAVDKKVIPLGSTVIINGEEYIAEDTGVKGNHIDIYFGSHRDALNFGVQRAEVFIKTEDPDEETADEP